jgi:hypothetical protein
VPHWPTEHDDEPSLHVVQLVPQSDALVQLVPNWQQDRHAGYAQWPLSEHQESPAAHTPGHAGN